MTAMTLLLASTIALLAAPAVADVYQVTYSATDATVYGASDTPTYEAKYRVAGGAETVLPATSLPAGSATITANPGQRIELAMRAVNASLTSAWTACVAAVTQPRNLGAFTVILVRAGP
jgi:hypothetical protein